MNRIIILTIMVISFGLIASPAIADGNLSNADFFYGVTFDNQSGTNVPDGPTEVDVKEKEAAATLPDDRLTPEIFYGYTDLTTKTTTNVDRTDQEKGLQIQNKRKR